MPSLHRGRVAAMGAQGALTYTRLRAERYEMAQSWKCIAMEFGDKENAGLVAFWMQMSEPCICKQYAALAESAPDLLEALKDATARLESFIGSDCECDNTHLQNETTCCLCEYRAAIAKATQEAPNAPSS